MGRHSCCYKQKLRKGLWSPEEDEKLLNYITKHGHGCWSSVPKLAGIYDYTNFITFCVYHCHNIRKISNHPIFSFSFSFSMYLLYYGRFAEMWQELQVEVDKLP